MTFPILKRIQTLPILLFLSLFISVLQLNAQYSDKLIIEKMVIQFEDASDQIASGYIPILYRLADSLNSNPSINLLIRGHVCCVKSNRLAKRRAKAVRYYLELFEVNPARLKIKGMRNSIPVIFPEKSKNDELKNMRVDFIVLTN